jgi:FAD:protein FMN transferase
MIMNSISSSTTQIYKRGARLMGNQFEISVVENDTCKANNFIEEAINEIKRIEKLLTTFDESSQTNQINQMAGVKPVVVDKEVFQLIERSIRVSELTQGAFDITYGSLDKKIWNFDTTMTRLPDAVTAKQTIQHINYRNIILNPTEHSVFLTKAGMRIGFGGIGKGYAAESAKRKLQQSGVDAGIINASGDLSTWGLTPQGRSWTVGIADPHNKLNVFSEMELSNMSIATSGDYEKFVIIDGKKYSHTINPRTGYPVRGISSVSIISPNAELCDALTTPVMVMGIKRGLYMINQMKDIGCIIIDEQQEIFTSNNIRLK